AGLSTEEEIELISRDFKPLVEIGAVAVEVLPHATPMSFHGYISTGHFDVVHFIGHGEFLDESGALLFEGTRGTAQSLTARTLRLSGTACPLEEQGSALVQEFTMSD